MAIDIKKFVALPYRNYPFFKELIIPMVDWALDSTQDQFEYITGKYTNYTKLDPEIAKELIYELGYEYILDVVNLNSEDVRIIFGYLKLFHILKGSKEGLRFVVELLGYEFKEIEWHEKEDGSFYTIDQLMGDAPLDVPLVTEPYTFKVALELIIGSIEFDKIAKFKKFTRHYVYDILKLFLNISFTLADLNISFGGFIDQKIKTEGIISIHANINGFIDIELKSLPIV